MLKKIFFILIIFLLITAFFLLGLEVLMRLGLFQPAFGVRVGDDLFRIHLDRSVLFKVKPRSREGINSQGYYDSEFPAGKSGRTRILFIGDSFIMGFNVAVDRTLPKILEKKLASLPGASRGYEVLNMGILGYGPDQALIRLLDEGFAMEPDMVILGIYAANDFNDIYKNRLFSLDHEGRIRRNRSNAVTSKISISEVAYLMEFFLWNFNVMDSNLEKMREILFFDTPAFDMMRDIDSEASKNKTALMRGVLEAFEEEMGKRHIDFLVVIIPSYFNIRNNKALRKNRIPPENDFVLEDLLESICRKESIPCINLYPYYINMPERTELYEDRTRHLSAFGYETTAAIIYDYLAGKPAAGPRQISIP